MGYFTTTEYQTMLVELSRNPCVFDTLIRLAKKTLFASVRKWCNGHQALKNRGYEEDIMQNINLRLVKYFLKSFRRNPEDVIGNSSEFVNWLFKVARNEFYTFSRKHGKVIANEGTADPEKNKNTPTYNMSSSIVENERILFAFQTVLSASSKPHILLTWLVVMLMINDDSVDRIDATRILVDELSDKPLDEIYNLVSRELIQQMVLPADSPLLEQLRSKLDAQTDGTRVGDRPLRSFFMKKGETDSVSDWINRMNGLIDKNGERKKREKNKEKNHESSDRKRPD